MRRWTRVPVLALTLLWREWRAGELGVLLLALTIAVAALTGVGFLVSRIGGAVAAQASEVLAADLRLGAPQPIGEASVQEAARRGLATARTLSTVSVVFNGEHSQLTNVEAVSAGYPLRGELKVAGTPFAPGEPVRGIPPPGEVWPDSRLLTTLGAQVGTPLSLGAITLKVGRVLISRPDQESTFASLTPTLLMNEADVPATQLIQPGSRASYAALFAGEPKAVTAFKGWLAVHRRPAERIRDIQDVSPQIQNAVARSGRFLSLASLVSVLLCAIAVAMSARRYVHRHLDTVALMKTLGATRALILSVTVLQLVAVAGASAVAGSLIGFFTQEWLVTVLRSLLVQSQLPPPTLEPVGIAFLTALAVLAGFAAPPLLQLVRVPALRVLRRDVGPPPPLLVLAFGPAVAVVAFLIYWVVRDAGLFLRFGGGLAAFIALLAGAGLLLIQLTSRLRGQVGVSWRYGIANLSRRRAGSLVQIVAFGTGIMILLLLGICRQDLFRDWQRTLPADLPNYFFINIPPAEREHFVSFLAARGGRTTRVLPMIRGRLTLINGQPAEERAGPRGRGGPRGGQGLGGGQGPGRGQGEDQGGDQGRGQGRGQGQREDRGEGGENLATREQNISWSEELGDDNRIVAGRWWGPADRGQPLVSLASEMQESLNVQVGDQLTFDIAGETVQAKIASVRKVKWDSFQPNFMLVFPPGLLDDTAGSYLTSAYFQPGNGDTLAQLAKTFPSVSIFDIGALLASVRSVLDKAVLAVQSVFLFTLAAGLTVLLAAVQSTRDERAYESAMLRTLGASRSTVLSGIVAEFATLGVLCGVLASAGASVAAYFLTTRLLELPYTPDARVWLYGIVSGTLVVAASGWLATRQVVRQPPMITLRA